MKNRCLAVLSFAALLALPLTSALADTIYQFTGTFTYTFTSIDLQLNPGYSPEFAARYANLHEGDTFNGTYYYFSPTLDMSAPSPGLAYRAYGLDPQPDIPFFAFDIERPYGGVLVVSGGHITGAGVSIEEGPGAFTVTNNTFGFGTNFSGVNFSAKGTINWGDPQRVPDAGSTAAFLGTALVGLAVFRRRLTSRKLPIQSHGRCN